ncbi:MAG: hypothetical protein K2X63_10455, partial [Burkholderiaceae bacterium]|nr:hypothetical protein [Burkholderiaceae bacterium]
MNDLSIAAALPLTVTPELILRHSQTPALGHDWLGSLAEHCLLSRGETLHQVGTVLGYPIASEQWADDIAPDFVGVKYAEMLERVALIGENVQQQRIALIGRPFDQELGAWLAARAQSQTAGQLHGQLQAIFLADPQAILLKLEQHEVAFSAVADAVGLEESIDLVRDTTFDLTLTSIQSENSPAVKLLNSTIFDALRFEASDIHMESL